MPAKRCSDCGINYPTQVGFTVLSRCQVCEGNLDYFEHATPQEDWARIVATRKREIEYAAETANLIPSVEAKVRVRDDQLWISSHDIIRSGVWKHFATDDLLAVGQQVFSVVAYHEPTREYLVESIALTLDLPVLAEEPPRLIEDGTSFNPNVKLMRAIYGRPT